MEFLVFRLNPHLISLLKINSRNQTEVAASDKMTKGAIQFVFTSTRSILSAFVNFFDWSIIKIRFLCTPRDLSEHSRAIAWYMDILKWKLFTLTIYHFFAFAILDEEYYSDCEEKLPLVYTHFHVALLKINLYGTAAMETNKSLTSDEIKLQQQKKYFEFLWNWKAFWEMKLNGWGFLF